MYSELLVPVDRGLRSNTIAVHEAAEIAAETNGTIHLLYVYPDTPPTDPWKNETGLPKPLAEAESDLKSFDIDISFNTKDGNPSDEISEFALEHDLDVIVMATYGRTGFRRLTLGSTTEDTIRQSPCPVIAVTDD